MQHRLTTTAVLSEICGVRSLAMIPPWRTLPEPMPRPATVEDGASNEAIVEANAGADAPADVEPLAQTEILLAGLEAGANKAQEAAMTQEEKQRADEEKRRADEEKRRADACLQQTLRVPTADAQN